MAVAAGGRSIRSMDEAVVEEAAALARRLHAGQTRKGSEVDYFDGHLAPVARIVRDAGGDAAQVAAAYLHDAAEDHGGRATLEAIRERFGPDIAGMVEDLSDSLADTTAGEPKQPWRARKQAYVDAMAFVPIRSVEVAAADKLHNVTSMLEDLRRVGDEVWERFTVGDPAEHLWFHDAVTRAIAARLGPHPTAVALRQAVDRLGAAVERGHQPARSQEPG